MQMIKIEVKTIEESPKYNQDENFMGWAGAKLTGAIITKDGMESGNPSLDLQFVDENGKKFIALVSGNIFRAIAIMAKDHYKDGGADLVH